MYFPTSWGRGSQKGGGEGRFVVKEVENCSISPDIGAGLVYALRKAG